MKGLAGALPCWASSRRRDSELKSAGSGSRVPTRFVQNYTGRGSAGHRSTPNSRPDRPRRSPEGTLVRGGGLTGCPQSGTVTAAGFLGLSSNGCGWVEARSAGRRGVLAARVASELTAHGVHLTGGGRGAPWPGVGRSGVAAGRTACQRATRVLRCATALRVTHRPSLRSSSRYGPCGPAWTGASRPSTTTRKSATTGGLGIDAG